MPLTPLADNRERVLTVRRLWLEPAIGKAAASANAVFRRCGDKPGPSACGCPKRSRRDLGSRTSAGHGGACDCGPARGSCASKDSTWSWNLPLREGRDAGAGSLFAVARRHGEAARTGLFRQIAIPYSLVADSISRVLDHLITRWILSVICTGHVSARSRDYSDATGGNAGGFQCAGRRHAPCIRRPRRKLHPKHPDAHCAIN